MIDLRVRQNYWAILLAALGCFLLESVWFTVFQRQWLAGIGRPPEWLNHVGNFLYLQSATALVAEALMAAAISRIIQMTGPQTAARGIRVGALLWLAFIFTTFSTEYVFEAKPLSVLAVNAGFWLAGACLMGGIVGGWKRKSLHPEVDHRQEMMKAIEG